MQTLEPKKTGRFIVNPATGESIAEILEHPREIVPMLVQKAKVAQEEWAKTSYKEREHLAREAAHRIHQKASQIAHTISICTGKTPTEALVTEVIPAALACLYYARRVPKILRPKRLPCSSLLFANKKSVLYRVPYGVVGIISPWNYPFAIPMHELVTALLTGNGVVLKVATQAQPVGEEIATLLQEAGFPRGLFHLVHLPGSEAGSALLESGIGKLFFTGSTETGKLLMQEAGKQLIPVSLELGGNDAMLVLTDAPLQRAAAGAVWAGVSNCGQSCGGVERIYVEKPVYSTFLELLRKEVKSLRQGTGSLDLDFGSLTTEEQKRKVEAQVQEALARGARMIETSSPPKELSLINLFYPAQILEVTTDNLSLMQEETFGPVLAVCPVESVEEAIQRANATRFGLTASVWSSSKQRAHEVASQLQAGVVTINDHLLSHGMPETPWGGFHQSGIGRTHGDAGIEEMTQLKVVVWERLPWLKRNIFWQPVDASVYKGMLAGLTYIAGKGLGTRLRGIRVLTRWVIKRLRSNPE
ncbi:MAG: aldehyde dehydrogenase family protein [Spirochaetales bacterium]